ncbi:retrovirus-related Pol polyprotein from type-2 retrotransposable element R2DM [Elysia marginata]|uniref:Retrovirus-related Pol polyprotein from type-2 retrotransposable element R2DM n=1 Tax=Elysia marginata TaxID=1093978 RepID=A0AAV4GD39_9GAST|nr:retrovirus-related Pol polyprotein from type-2 retrotransposable element R2DM [Elysia marginata]
MGNITIGEVKEAIQKLNCGKAPGDDGVCPEMLKAETEETPIILRDILQNIWTEGNVPFSWRKGTIFEVTKERYQDIQLKTKDLCETASKIGLKVNTRKTQALRTNTTNMNPITLEEKPQEEVQEFIYLGSKITADGVCIGEIKARISKASQAFALLRPIWKTPNISTHTKIRIFRSNVLSVLLYGA